MSELVAISARLRTAVDALAFGPPVAWVYDPLAYAWAPHVAYLERFGAGEGRALLVGMNPGPFGMAQTGVPFGAVPLVRDWMGIAGEVDRSAPAHPKRPVEGFACAREEVSGARLWGWARRRFGTPEAFFARFFVWTHCPLMFLEASGRNLTPDKLRAAEQAPLLAACDAALAEAITALRPSHLLGIGGYAEARLRAALPAVPPALRRPVARVLHPSPASPAANRGWETQAEADLRAAGVALPEAP